MDWANERYVRVYVRDTVGTKRLSWEARCVFWELLRKVDRAGVLDLSGLEPAEGLSVALDVPEDVASRCLTEWSRDGRAAVEDSRIVVRSMIPAQETAQSDRARARESRERRAACAESQPVTPCHAPSRAVTASYAPSHSVTLSRPDSPSVPSRQTDQSAPAEPAPSESFEDSIQGRVWAHYLAARARAMKAAGKRATNLVLTPKRRAHLKARAKDSTEAELHAAIDALWASEWHMANGFTGPEYVFRSREIVEDRLSRALNDAGRSSEAEHLAAKSKPLPVLRQLFREPDEPLRRRPTPTKPPDPPKTERPAETEAERDARIETERQRAVAALAAMAVTEVAQ
jgi:hypothetical protein